jgi:DNA polymerase III delta prime subunit
MAHHAYIAEGSQTELDPLAGDAKERFGFSLEHDPDVHARAFEKFGIDESRWLTETASLKSSSGKALFILGIASITTEAQQALLKLFEEPQHGTVFVLLVPHGALLPTLLSRLLPYPAEVASAAQSTPQQKEAREFLKLSGKDRSDVLVKMLKDDEGVKERVRDFINALEKELAPKASKSAQARAGLEDIAMVRDYLRDRSPSLKILLEHLALSLPVL